MATLKISDLSVGDWVQDNYGNYVKVMGIWQGSNFNYQVDLLRDGKIGTMVPCNIHPIPITAEILKKIGFEESTDLFTAYHADKVWISYDQRSETWGVTINFDVMPTLYVKLLHIHQLQHALRLAGLDKEINL